MPNWCETDYWFVDDEGNGSQIEALWTFLQTAYDGQEGRWELYRLWLALGYTHADLTTHPCRGYIWFADRTKDGLFVNVNTAWEPIHDVWNEILCRLQLNTIAYFYYAEEPGQKLYETNDRYNDWGSEDPEEFRKFRIVDSGWTGM